jgi:hypothetical protein
VRHPQQRGEEGVAAALLDEAALGVDEDEREVGGRGPVTMLRVYWMWPGVSAMTNLRFGVAK